MAAADVGLNYAEGTGLSAANDPRAIAANIIRIAFGFLGIIAVGIIIYAGWLYMTAAGEEEKVEKAKKILIQAFIGLLICLASFAIASFILSRLSGAAGIGGGNINSPGGGIGGGSGSAFNITATSPYDQMTGVVRNAAIKTFFNSAIGDKVDSAVLSSNFKVEKIAAIDPATKAETPLAAQLVAGASEIIDGRMVINFLDNDACGDAQGTLNCLPEWSKFRVTINGFSGIVSVNNQSLSCSAGAKCQFVFSTGDLLDYNPPQAGILPAQICQDDGTLKADANTVTGWGRDDMGISELAFSKNKPGGAAAPAGVIMGAGQPYQSAPYKYDTKNLAIGDKYIFSVSAYDAANHEATSSFSAIIRPGHCCNGVKDTGETDVDCGGQCGACDGGACAADISVPGTCSDSLCASQFCTTTGSTQKACEAAGYGAGATSCCLCQREPVISGITPAGGFCSDNANKACLADSDCGAGIACDAQTPNGAAGNFITITGKYFGAVRGKVFFSGNAGTWLEAKLADDASLGNSYCKDNVWSDGQIIAVVPVGATAGPIKVTTAAGFSDDSQSNPPLNDFAANSISRPGLCKLDPAHGIMNQPINYYGVKLSGGQAYYGGWQGKIAALNQNFSSDKQGTAAVPNLGTGRTSGFVARANENVYSNFLIFNKDPEPYTGPNIVSFSPSSGKAGQYVTIRGSGFGRIRAASKVFFGNAEADYNFPAVCADSVWSDNQAIVKVPAGLADGDYIIRMQVGNYTVDTAKLSPGQFTVNSSLGLAPSICKISPAKGQVNSAVDLYGEYFGAQGAAVIRFQSNKDQAGAGISSWGEENKASKAVTTVPAGAISGEVKIIQAQTESNPVNFAVGVCSADAECGGSAVCCPNGSPAKGQCKAFAPGKTSVQDLCFSQVKSSVYEWDFSTGFLSTCGLGQTKCGSSCCNPGDTCDPAGNNGNGRCDSIDCANGPTCGSACCSEATGCIAGACPPSITDNPFLTCAGYGPGQCQAAGSCPNSPGSCSGNAGGSSDTGVKCGDDECNKLGRCRDAGGCTYSASLNKCKTAGACDLAQTVSDINNKQFALKCGSVDGKNVWYYDSNQTCATSGYTKSIDKTKCVGAACNVCSAGFSCVKENNAGVCAADTNLCPAGSSCSADNKCLKTIQPSCECCCDKTQNNAAGNPGCCTGTICGDTCGAGGNFGKCTGCTVKDANGNVNQTASNAKCNCTGTTGKFCSTGEAGGLGACLDCTALAGAAECSTKGAGSCCVDAEKNNACRGSNNLPTIKSPYTGDNNNYCAYYQCNSSGVGCNAASPIASSTAAVYADNTCANACTVTQPGAECVKEDGTSKKNVCDNSICPKLSCLKGDKDSNDTACGTCCCDPNAKDASGAAFNQCTSINPKLTCIAGKGTCTGGNRGLCCGCSLDSDCGNTAATGCGGETCCQARPAVTDQKPFGGNICRNSIIEATFNKPMRLDSLKTNVIVAADYGLDACPAGAAYLSAAYKATWLEKVKYWLAKVPVVNKLFASPAQAENLSGNFCAVAGTVSGSVDNGRTKLQFSPRQLLEPGRRYYVIIKGESDLTDAIHDGVLSQDGIGLNPTEEKTFNGITYKGKIWYFTTLGKQAANNGVCKIAAVEIEPVSYLFQTNKNDSGDDDIAKAAFDTVGDSDLVYTAAARAADGTELNPLDGAYDWTWSWSSGSPNIFELPGLSGLPGNKQMVRAKENVTEGKSVITAKAAVAGSLAAAGEAYQAGAEAYLMVCANPWPAVITSGALAGAWFPWQDNGANCKVGGTCYNTNYELYYCRDAGGPGTADDLPAIQSDNAVIRPYYSDQPDILKEFYFFREGLPAASGGFTVSVLPQGGGVTANWDTVAGAAGYKIYYGTVSGAYSDSVDAGSATSKDITGLTNGVKYYFSLTSYTAQKAESGYSDPVSATPKDTLGPNPQPTSFNATPKDKQVDLAWSETDSTAVNYRVFYKASANCDGSVNFGSSIPAADKTATVNNLANGVNYCFGVIAYDSYGNKSATTTISAVPLAP